MHAALPLDPRAGRGYREAGRWSLTGAALESDRRAPHRGWARRLGYGGLALCISVVVLELGARTLIRDAALASIPVGSVREAVKGGDIVYDPILGWKRSVLPNPRFGIDRNGFRHAEVQAEKPTRWRGFALGDSQTYGAGVRAGEDWPTVAEAHLRTAGVSVELINAGLSGYTSRQDYRLLVTKLRAFDPDFVVVDARTLDDLRDPGPSPLPSGASAVERVLFYSRFYRGLRLLVAQVKPEGVPMRTLTQRPTSGLDPNRYGNHDRIQGFGDEQGIAVWFVDYPFKGRPAESLVERQFLPEGARLIPATKALADSGMDADACFLDNNHLTVAGNAVVGRAVADALLPSLAR